MDENRPDNTEMLDVPDEIETPEKVESEDTERDMLGLVDTDGVNEVKKVLVAIDRER